MLCFQGPRNEQDGPSTDEPATPDPAESPDINTSCYDEERHDNVTTASYMTATIDQGGPMDLRRAEKWKLKRQRLYFVETSC